MSKLQNFLIPALKSVIVSACCPWLCLQVVFYRWAMLIKRIDFCNAMWHIDNELLVYKCAPASNCTFTTSHDYSRRCISNIPEDLWSYSIDFLARCVWILQGNVYLATFFSGTSDVTTLHEKKNKKKKRMWLRCIDTDEKAISEALITSQLSGSQPCEGCLLLRRRIQVIHLLSVRKLFHSSFGRVSDSRHEFCFGLANFQNNEI